MGLGNNDNHNTPQEVTGLPEGEMEQLSLGNEFSLIVIDNSLYMWGNNEFGQLGLGDTKDKNVPTKVTGLPDGEIQQISLGSNHSAALVKEGEDNHLYIWGHNDYGQLGMSSEDYNDRLVPTEVTKLPEGGEIKQISLGENFTTAVVNAELKNAQDEMIKKDWVFTWGSNRYGQSGTGNFINQFSVPQRIYDLPDTIKIVKQISAGKDYVVAILNDGSSDRIFSWGHNELGQLGLGTYSVDPYDLDISKPQEIHSFWNQVKQVSSGYDSTSAIIDNKLYTWGHNDLSQLGLGEGSLEKYNSPQKVNGLPDGEIKQISLGDSNHSIINTTIDGADDTYVYGSNNLGQLGIGTDEQKIDSPKLLFH